MPSAAGHRLYVKGRHLSYQRGKRNTNPGTSLIKIGTEHCSHPHKPMIFSSQANWTILDTFYGKDADRFCAEGVDDQKGANFYLGKKVAFVYRAHREIRGSKIRVIWGKVTRPHGNNGVVRAQFRRNLPPKSFGATVRVMLYPSSI
ncbi:MAG: hypothetical protein M1833_002501 [Piccolia ochrophora]|nr:MAG: hypothetical protein M1833_002501 [Piccolia ochrophora]